MPKLRKGQTVTPKQKVLAHKYATNGFNGTKAAMEVYNVADEKSAAVIASKELRKVNVQNEVQRVMQAKGIGTEALAEKHAMVLGQAPEKKMSWNEYIRAIELGYKINDAMPAAKHINANMTMKMYQDMDVQDLLKEVKRLDSLVEDLGYK